MPLIRPISDLRNKAMEISELCHREDQPIFITRNGKGDLVVMSHAHYERLQSLIELYRIGDYLVFYVIKSKIVQIRRIIHGARNYGFLP